MSIAQRKLESFVWKSTPLQCCQQLSLSWSCQYFYGNETFLRNHFSSQLLQLWLFFPSQILPLTLSAYQDNIDCIRFHTHVSYTTYLSTSVEEMVHNPDKHISHTFYSPAKEGGIFISMLQSVTTHTRRHDILLEQRKFVVLYFHHFPSVLNVIRLHVKRTYNVSTVTCLAPRKQNRKRKKRNPYTHRELTRGQEWKSVFR